MEKCLINAFSRIMFYNRCNTMTLHLCIILVTRRLIGQCQNICDGIDIIIKRHCPLADVWTNVTESARFRFKIVQFKDNNAKKCIRMRITVMKIVICKGKSSI